MEERWRERGSEESEEEQERRRAPKKKAADQGPADGKAEESESS